ncbi:AAA family ATPase [Aliarcobacter butzleri]|uniref:AAA family ATPase n=1 Tax=Aliarcobacter butzleri TaxID=28197 RepID=UPI0012F78704|nr:AAA family ATPase [Aliarcobacter butzleri]
MGSTLTQIAGQLQSSQKKVQLIYAFNGTGKTRLSKEFKQLISPKNDDEESEETRAKILYYNAFTEDLFSWDNDLENDSELKLKIQPNSFTQWILQEQGQDQNIVTSFQRFSGNKLTPTFSPDFSEVTFSFESGNDENLTNVKISKGEESNFIWSIFYTLIKQVINVLNVQEITDRETDQFNNLEYVFIDDPVSSLDENHLIELAVNLSQLIKSSNSDIKFILSTHNPLFYNVLYNELGLKSKKGSFMLIKNDDGTFDLEVKDGDSNKSFSYHLYLRDTIKHAIEHNEIAKYHFVLLRNLYEKTANFLGYEKWSDLLPDEDREAYISRVMNFYSHSSLSSEQIAEPTDPEKQMVNFLFNYLIDNSKFWKQVENNES